MDQELAAEARERIMALVTEDPRILDVHQLRTRASGPYVHGPDARRSRSAPDPGGGARDHGGGRRAACWRRFPRPTSSSIPIRAAGPGPHGGAFAEAGHDHDPAPGAALDDPATSVSAGKRRVVKRPVGAHAKAFAARFPPARIPFMSAAHPAPFPARSGLAPGAPGAGREAAAVHRGAGALLGAATPSSSALNPSGLTPVLCRGRAASGVR